MISRRGLIKGLFLTCFLGGELLANDILEIEGFSWFAGPDMLDDLSPGLLLHLVERSTPRRVGVVLANGVELGFVPLVHGREALLSTGMLLSTITREPNGMHRAWARPA